MKKKKNKKKRRRKEVKKNRLQYVQVDFKVLNSQMTTVCCQYKKTEKLNRLFFSSVCEYVLQPGTTAPQGTTLWPSELRQQAAD